MLALRIGKYTVDKRYVEQNNIVSRYVAGDLTDEQIDQFEILMFEDQDVAREVHLELALRDELRQRSISDAANEEHSDHASVVDVEMPPPGVSTHAANEPSFSPSRAVAVAASVAALACFWWAIQGQSRVTRLEEALVAANSPRDVPAVVLIGNKMNGVESDYTIPANESAILWLDVGGPPSGTYGAKILDARGGEVWSKSDVEISDLATFVVYVPGLDEGQYSVSITSEETDGSIIDLATYALTVKN